MVISFPYFSFTRSDSLNLKFSSTMPTIAGPNKEMMVTRSERIAGDGIGLDADSLQRKRKLRSDAVAVQGSPICTPMKWKSPRLSAALSPRTLENGNAEDSIGKVFSSRESVAKKLFNLIDGQSRWDPRDNKQMKSVKEALHVSTAPSTVVGREDEQARVFSFVKACVEEQKPGSLYICGCPGTGKSLSMEKVKQQVIEWTEEAGVQPPEVISLNCTSLTNTSEIFSKILGECHSRKKAKGSISPLQQLQNLYSEKQSSGSRMMLIVADELDYLITRDRGVLHDLFMLTTLRFSRCILIGIANAIDLADRFLPKLKSLSCTPVVITFRAYSKEQILRILQERLMALPYTVFQQQTLELCARKVAAASGDMRRALSICRSAVEILETALREGTNSPMNEDESLKQHAPTQDNIIVRIDHMAAALARTFKSPVVDTIQSIPQHQQIILFSAVKAFRGRKKDTTVGELNKSYMELCKTSMMPPVGNAEFTSMCRVLSDQGLLKLGQGRDDKLKRVTLKVDESDITFASQGIRFFRNCLQ